MRLTTPRLRVQLDDGTEHDVQTMNPDAIRFDVTRGRKGWPDSKDAPLLWATFLAWAAMRREGKLSCDVDEALEERIAAIEFLGRDGETLQPDPETGELDVDEIPTADPTRPDRSGG